MIRDCGNKTPPYIVPDYRIYKVSDAPELVKTEKALAAKGLKDPWLRNEVWRFNRKEFQTTGYRFFICIFRGWKVGVGLFALHIIGNVIYDKVYPDCKRTMW